MKTDIRVAFVAIRRGPLAGDRQALIFGTAIKGSSETRLASVLPAQDLLHRCLSRGDAASAGGRLRVLSFMRTNDPAAKDPIASPDALSSLLFGATPGADEPHLRVVGMSRQTGVSCQ